MKLDRIVGSSNWRDRAGAEWRHWKGPAGRIAAQEYLPFGAWILAWAALTAALGLADAVRLMAANGFVQAVRAMFLTQSFDAISARTHSSPAIKSRARGLTIRVDLAVLAGCLALLLPFAIGLQAIGAGALATMVLIMAAGLPARTPAVLLLDRCNIGTAWRIGSGLALLAGAVMVLTLGLGWIWGAAAVAMREWGGLLAVWLFRRARSGDALPALGQLDFTEVAARTSAAARRRLVYRLSKVALSALGPVGSIMARTGRGSGLDARIAAGVSISPVPIGLLALGASVAAALLLAASLEPGLLLVSSVLARVAGAALSVLLWWRWNDRAGGMQEWLNEDL